MPRLMSPRPGSLLPSYRNQYCTGFDTCIQIQRTHLDHDWLAKVFRDDKEEPIPLVAAYQTSHGRIYARVSAHQTNNEDYYHIHFNTFRRNSDRPVPKSTHARKDLGQVLDKLAGVEVELRFEARFAIPEDKIGENALCHHFPRRVGTKNVSLKTSGAIISFQDTEVFKTDWFSRRGKVRLVIESQDMPLRMDADYIGFFQALMSRLFMAMFADEGYLEDRSHEPE